MGGIQRLPGLPKIPCISHPSAPAHKGGECTLTALWTKLSYLGVMGVWEQRQATPGKHEPGRRRHWPGRDTATAALGRQGSLCAREQRHTWDTAPPLCTPIIPISGGSTGTKDADSLFHDLNPLPPSSLTSSHLLPLKQCRNRLPRQAEKADLQKRRFLVRTNADAPLHMLSNPNFILINPY